MNVAKVFFTVNYNNNNNHYYHHYYYYYYYTRLNVYRQLKRCVDKLTTVENRSVPDCFVSVAVHTFVTVFC